MLPLVIIIPHVLLSLSLTSVFPETPAHGMSGGRPASAQLGLTCLLSLLPQSPSYILIDPTATCTTASVELPPQHPCNCCCVAGYVSCM